MSALMLSRPSIVLMLTTARQPDWDIFCNVIDNYGDIGVCWRLARQLATEHGLRVRLWVDELSAFHSICPGIDRQLPVQLIQGIEVHHWTDSCSDVIPASVVLEAFACRLPDQFVADMAIRNPKPVWVNLDYLSAEDWVAGCHALPSPHPHLPLTKYFFFPGFTEATGGLLREHDLRIRRHAFHDTPGQQEEFWGTLGVPRLPANALKVSLFAYENPAITDLLSIWAEGRKSVCCLVPLTRTLPAVEAFAGRSLQAGDIITKGNLEIRMLPFVAQADYDRLLWSCDINFVRGEDSFVRAQWAARPMLWHIYPQSDNAHLVKLKAFLDVYCAGLPDAIAGTVRQFYGAWNGESAPARISPDLWQAWMKALPALDRHALEWEKNLSKQEDLCSSLVRFCRSKL